MPQINVGKVTLVPRGQYSSSTTYAKLDFVVYEGSSYVSVADSNTGHTPSSSSAYWQVLAMAGDDISITSQTITYAAQNASAFTGVPPTTGWQSTIPDVGAGNYLWTRIVTVYSDGATSTANIPAKYGTNGSGVGTVTGLKLGSTGSTINPDSDGILIVSMDSSPSQSSANLVNSGGIYTFVGNVQTSLETAIAAKASASVARTVTIDVSDWSSKSCTKSVDGVTDSNNIIVSPAPSSFTAYGAAQIRATAQSNGTVTFECEEVPDTAVTVNVVILG